MFDFNLEPPVQFVSLIVYLEISDHRRGLCLHDNLETWFKDPYSIVLSYPLSLTHQFISRCRAPLSDQRRGSDMDLLRSSAAPPDVYLSPPSATDFVDLDSTECWSDSEFEDDLDDDTSFYATEEQDRISQSTDNSNNSEVCICNVCWHDRMPTIWRL